MSQETVAVQTCRILYFGPGGAGKRDNLQQIVASVPAERHLAFNADDPERQIAFRMRSGTQGEWNIAIQAIDTGREIYQKSPAKDRPPFDGVVFVAHSSSVRLDQSLSSLEALKTYVDSWGMDLMSVPMVIQYNMRDDPGCLPVDRLESLLNPWGLLSFPTSTQQGEGVLETLKSILSLTISQLLQEDTLEEEPEPIPVPPPPPPAPIEQPHSPVQEAVEMSDAVFTQDRKKSVFQVVNEDRSGIFFDDLRPPIILPVKIPRKLLEKYGSARIILEVTLDDDDSVLG